MCNISLAGGLPNIGHVRCSFKGCKYLPGVEINSVGFSRERGAAA